jgi:putative nucleotidyltransferase with HDIG domain
MRVQVFMLAVGDRLISDAYNSIGLHVLSAGKVLDVYDITKLNNHNVDYVDIAAREDLLVDASAASANNSIMEDQAIAYTEAIDGIKSLFEMVLLEGIVHKEDVDSSFAPLISSVEQENDVVSLLLSLNSKDDYTYQHSVQVGMLSYYMAKWMGIPEEEAQFIGKAGFLHDIGKSKIDNKILTKLDQLDDTEYEELKSHTLYGYEILKQSFDETALALTALQHHERLDGKGYPHGKQEPDIHPYAKIVAVADVYSTMISNRIYEHKKDLLVVLRELHRMSFGELDPNATQTFIKNMIPNFIGKRAELSDGRVGTIIMTNPTDFFRPLVRVDDEFIDLSHEHSLDITSITL